MRRCLHALRIVFEQMMVIWLFCNLGFPFINSSYEDLSLYPSPDLKKKKHSEVLVYSYFESGAEV